MAKRNSYAFIVFPLIFCFISSSFMYSCQDEETENLKKKEQELIDDYIAKHSELWEIDTIAEDGLFYIHQKTGIGEIAREDSTIVFHYSGKILQSDLSLEGDQEFVTSLDTPKEPMSVTLGAGEIIEGLENGISGMRVGDTRYIIMKSTYGYGDVKFGSVPAYSPLVFYVRLIDVE